MFPFEKYFTFPYLVGGGALIAVILLGLTCAQKSCGKKHEDNAIVAGAQADVYKAQVKDLKNQIAGKEAEIGHLKAQGQALLKNYAVLKAKVAVVQPPPPATDAALASGLQDLGLRPGLQVQINAPSSLLSTVDAQTVWVGLEEAKRVPLLNEALVACDQSVKAQEAIVASQDSQIVLFRQGLMASQSETDARTAQVNELAKALRVEKSKGWKLIAYPVAAAALTAFWMKK